tara:strand:+ start:2177 stop:2401 length:225 start_codon:yes stop_codon:yes gene_type:complete
MLIENDQNRSKYIERAIYNYITKTLKIRFVSGQVYEYENFDEEVYDKFIKAESQQAFFTEQIKPNYDGTELLLD